MIWRRDGERVAINARRSRIARDTITDRMLQVSKILSLRIFLV